VKDASTFVSPRRWQSATSATSEAGGSTRKSPLSAATTSAASLMSTRGTSTRSRAAVGCTNTIALQIPDFTTGESVHATPPRNSMAVLALEAVPGARHVGF
jgi:hypothetical protein